MLSFKEFEVNETDDVSARIERHTAQAGSVFQHRGISLEALKLAEDEVKRVLAQVEMDVRILGHIPVKDKPESKVKITEAGIKAYVNCHELAVASRISRAEAFKTYDTARALAQAYLDVKEFLALLMRDRLNRLHAEPKVKADLDIAYL